MVLAVVSPNSALSGMRAAASNIANRQTEGFEHHGIVQTASPDGGV
ncbi:MAG: hypothetical protein ACK4MZ_05960 [Thermomonas haemolytica]